MVAIAAAATTAKSVDVKALIPAIESGSPLGAAGPIVFRKADHTYVGEMTYVKFGADPSAKEGIKVSDVMRLQAKDYMEPATPGQKYVVE